MSEEKSLTPVKAIRAKCLDCCCDQSKEVELCPMRDCALWAYRLGKNPNIKRTLSYEQRMAARDRLLRGKAEKLLTAE